MISLFTLKIQLNYCLSLLVSCFKVEVFPNPFNHQFWVKLSGFGGKTNFELYSVDGKLLQVENWDISWNTLQSVETVNLPIGVYFYKIYDGQSSVQGKLIKQ